MDTETTDTLDLEFEIDEIDDYTQYELDALREFGY